jgi:hypothetical protein
LGRFSSFFVSKTHSVIPAFSGYMRGRLQSERVNMLRMSEVNPRQAESGGSGAVANAVVQRSGDRDEAHATSPPMSLPESSKTATGAENKRRNLTSGARGLRWWECDKVELGGKSLVEFRNDCYSE